MILRVSGQLPCWVKVDSITGQVQEVELNVASEMFVATEAFTDEYKDVTYDLADVELKIQNAAWPRPMVEIDHLHRVQM